MNDLTQTNGAITRTNCNWMRKVFLRWILLNELFDIKLGFEWYLNGRRLGLNCFDFRWHLFSPMRFV